MRDTFNGKENGRYKAMVTVYEESKAIATDGEGDIIRVVGRLATESYVSKTENKIVNKLVVKGTYMNRKKEGEKEKTEGYFDPVAIFKGVMFVDKMEELEDKLVITGVINEYKSKKATVGHRVEFICDEKESIEGMKSLVKIDDVANIGAFIKDIVEVKFLPEEETKELPLREVKGFGSAIEDAKKENERIEKENARRKELRENGLQIHKQGLVVSGSCKSSSTLLIVLQSCFVSTAIFLNSICTSSYSYFILPTSLIIFYHFYNLCQYFIDYLIYFLIPL